ncbi:PREDICTED: pentatricopeptide repeat-containing protein At5g40410, mitochondrial-like [Camelina sativa]|uniref:Pentatricopeptide repeat-containing protein At5g40410, mitochondrial-like n=1 Tax=Camelina sativa TaxID=90675 RepID=A0ABM1QR34_CAMSA|nr:PREDICTED: pentatricopeptide repeat-containing protein At5g40410, mitochondrial-like [Camelina sativa]
MPERDLVSWNSLISRYSVKGYLGKCFEVLSRMMMLPEVGFRPNEVTFLSMISACVHGGSKEEGRCIHGLVMKSGVLEEVKVVNALINWYGKTGDLSSSCRLFEDLSVKNLVSWNTMIVIHLQDGLALEGFVYFNMSRRVGHKPDQATFLTVLRVCEAIGVVRLAQGIHGMIMFCGFNANKCITTALLDLYAKLGRLEDSCTVFHEIISPDSMAWTAMLAAYATHGFGRDAIKHFELMVHYGISPDHVTFTHLLNACSHAGLVEEGKHYFETMSKRYRIEPRLDHYSCMVDLMGRSGILQDAYRLIKGMPMDASSGVWGALLGACRVYKDTQLGTKAAERLFELEPCDGRNYVMLSNIYSASGLWKDASRIRNLMKQKGLVRASGCSYIEHGCSYIEHGNKIHKFVVGDWSHPESEKIQKKLEKIRKKMTSELGFKSRTEFVLHDVDEDVKVEMINQHSEKIAMAFGLLVISPNESIVIRKNLRICGDCHETAKAISLIEKRRIIIRDSKRFHHFSEGSCSCKDYW